MIEWHDFDLQGKSFEPYKLEQASLHGRDVIFEGVVLAEVHCGAYQYRLYHTNTRKPEEQLVIAKMRLQNGKVEAEVISINDTDVLEDFCADLEQQRLGLNILHELVRQSGFPGYQTMGHWEEKSS